jgi:hypothetical protein
MDEYRSTGAQMGRGRRRLSPDGRSAGEEIDDRAAGLVTRDYFDKRLAEFEARITWKMVGLLGVQIVIFPLITKHL